MDSYALSEDIHRIIAGMGDSGEIYGSVAIFDDPIILLGASGREKLVKQLKQYLQSVNRTTSSPISVVFTSFTMEELFTLVELKRDFSNITFYISEELKPLIKNPDASELCKRYYIDEKEASRLSRHIPKIGEHIIYTSARSQINAEKEKVMILPYGGPHKGHCVAFAATQKILHVGLLCGYIVNKVNQYYMDLSGNVSKYLESFSFLDQAKTKIYVPSFDEPKFSSSSPLSTHMIRTSLLHDRETILAQIPSRGIDFPTLLRAFKSSKGDLITTDPYDRINLERTVLKAHLNELIDMKKIKRIDDLYQAI